MPKRGPLDQDGPDGTDLRGPVRGGHRGISQKTTFRIDDQMAFKPPAGHFEHALPIRLATRPDTQLTQDTAIQIQHQIRVRSINPAAGEKMGEMGLFHAEEITHRLELTLAGLFASRAKMIALDKQHLGDPASGGIQLIRIVQDLLPRHGRKSAG